MAKKTQSLTTLPGGKLNNYLNNISENFLDFLKSKKLYLIILILGILLLAVYKKSWFIAAIVNGTPVTNLELQSKLNTQFKTQTLDQMINEKIILLEATKNNALPTQQEIDQKIAELEESVGGKDTLDSLITQQGQTRSGLKDQIMIQLAITKLYDKEATVSADEVSKFIETNKDQLRATDSAGQQAEATNALKQQKLSQIFSQKFQELRQKANIKIF
mgnify:CR=1 FL=1